MSIVSKIDLKGKVLDIADMNARESIIELKTKSNIHDTAIESIKSKNNEQDHFISNMQEDIDVLENDVSDLKSNSVEKISIQVLDSVPICHKSFDYLFNCINNEKNLIFEYNGMLHSCCGYSLDNYGNDAIYVEFVELKDNNSFMTHHNSIKHFFLIYPDSVEYSTFDIPMGSGDNSVDLSDYYTKDEVNQQFQSNVDNVNNRFNEMNQQMQQIGELTNLQTINKSNIVNALNEVFQSASSGKGLIATAITGKGIDANETETFSQLATKIQQISGNTVISNTALGDKMYSFAVISDVHWGRSDYSVADDTIKMLQGLESLNVNFVCGCGDLVLDNPNTRIVAFKQLWDNYTSKTLYSCTGNHDALVTESVWQQNIGHGFRHSFEINGDVFLFMSTDNDVAITGTPSDFYSESLEWLANKMQENKGKRIFLFMHYPLYGYSGLAPGKAYGFSSRSIESSTIAGYLSSIENLMIFSGHSHQPFATEKENSTYNHIKFYEINAHNSATIGMPSIGLPRKVDLSYITDSNPIEGMVVNVHKKGVIFRGYDFVNNKYLDEYTYYLQVANNNSINLDVSVESITINENAYADFTVKLNREIEENLTVYLVKSNDYISLDKNSLTFTTENWNVAQAVRVSGIHQVNNYNNLLADITLSADNVNSKYITVTVNNIDVPPITYYSINKNLTGCSLSNTATQVEENTNYNSNIVLEDSYELQSAVVKMNGVDITSTAVSGNTINITQVTGNIEITVVANYVEVEGENILPVFANWTKDTNLPNMISNSNSLSSAFTFTSTGQGIKYQIPADIISANQGRKLIFKADEITLSNGTNIGIDLKKGTTDVVSMTTNANIGELSITNTQAYQIRIRVKSSATGLPATFTVSNLRCYIK